MATETSGLSLAVCLDLFEADASGGPVGAALAVHSIGSLRSRWAIVAISVGAQTPDSGIAGPASTPFTRTTLPAESSAGSATAAAGDDRFRGRRDGTRTHISDEYVCGVSSAPSVAAISTVSTSTSLTAICASKADTVAAVSSGATVATILASRTAPSVAAVGKKPRCPIDFVDQYEKRSSGVARLAIGTVRTIVAANGGWVANFRREVADSKKAAAGVVAVVAVGAVVRRTLAECVGSICT